MKKECIWYVIIAITFGEVSGHRLFIKDTMDFVIRFVLYMLTIVRTDFFTAHTIFQTLALLEALLALTIYRNKKPDSLVEFINKILF